MRLTTRSASADIVTRIAAVAATALPNVFTATLSTNADVRRGGYVERLGRWNAFPQRVPLLDSHRRESVDAVIGFVDNIRAEGGAVVADLHVSETRANVSTLMREGALRDVSIGFSAEAWRDSTENGERIRIGEGLSLREASVVVLGADPGARLGRGEEDAATRIRDLADTLRIPSHVAEGAGNAEVSTSTPPARSWCAKPPQGTRVSKPAAPPIRRARRRRPIMPARWAKRWRAAMALKTW